MVRLSSASGGLGGWRWGSHFDTPTPAGRWALVAVVPRSPAAEASAAGEAAASLAVAEVVAAVAVAVVEAAAEVVAGVVVRCSLGVCNRPHPVAPVAV